MEHRADEPPSPRASIDDLDALLADPSRWSDLDADTLRHLLFYRCLSYGLQPDEQSVPSLMSLYGVAVERLHPAVRQQVVLHLARSIERVHREHGVREGAGCTNALLPFLLEDPDPSVVSSAAAETALLLPIDHDDALSGPRYVRSLLDQVKGEDARAGVIAGLLQLGDSRLAPLVAEAWADLGEEGSQTLALLIQGFKGVHALTVDFLLAWAEAAAASPDEPTFGVVAATLARAGRHAAEHGVVDVKRRFPLTEAPEGQPYEAEQQVSLEEFAPRVEERLAAVATREPRAELMPHVLSYWGFGERGFRLAAGAAARTGAAAGVDEANGVCEPVAIDLAPDWPEHPERETLLEWGIFSPVGPSVDTLRLTPLDARAAVVHTLYTPGGTISRLVALLPAGPDAARVRSVVRGVMAANGRFDAWLLRSLPDYVYLPAGSPLDEGDVAASMALARRAALGAGEAPVPLRDQIERLSRLAADPWATTTREMDEARAAGDREEPCGASAGGRGDDEGEGHVTYRDWLSAAAAPRHVAIIRRAIPVAWQQVVEGGGE